MGMFEELRAKREPNVDAEDIAAAFMAEMQAEHPDFQMILRHYDTGPADVRWAINDTLISLTGWSLHSLIRKANLLAEEARGA